VQEAVVAEEEVVVAAVTVTVAVTAAAQVSRTAPPNGTLPVPRALMSLALWALRLLAEGPNPESIPPWA